LITDDVLQLLDETGGNARAVAERLDVSPSYVHRMKRERWTPPAGSANASQVEIIPAEETKPIVTQDQVIQSLAPNIGAIQELRDATIHKLRRLVDTAEISAEALMKLLNTLLKYETQLQELTRPAMNLYDQRTQTQTNVFGGLVDQLADLNPEQLRSLAGVDAPQKLNGEVIEHD